MPYDPSPAPFGNSQAGPHYPSHPLPFPRRDGSIATRSRGYIPTPSELRQEMEENGSRERARCIAERKEERRLGAEEDKIREEGQHRSGSNQHRAGSPSSSEDGSSSDDNNHSSDEDTHSGDSGDHLGDDSYYPRPEAPTLYRNQGPGPTGSLHNNRFSSAQSAQVDPRPAPRYSSSVVSGQPRFSTRFAPSSNAGSRCHSRRPSSPQGLGRGFTPDELHGRVDDLSISGQSSIRPTSLSGGMYNDNSVSRYQYPDQRPPGTLAPPTIDLGPLDPRKQMVDFLSPIRKSILPYVQPKDSIKAIGAAVIAEQRLADVILERGTQHSTAHRRDTVAGSVQWPDDSDSGYDQSGPVEGRRRRLEASPSEGYSNLSEGSVRSGARARYDDSLVGRNYTEEREPAFTSHQSDGYRQQSLSANPLEYLQVERYRAVPHPPSSRSTRQSQRPDIRDFVDPRSMHSAGRQSRRGPPMPPSRGGRYPDDIEDRWS